MANRVAITGIGAYTSMGNNSSEIWNNILNYELGYSVHEFEDQSINARYFGFLELDKKLLKKFPIKIRKMLPLFAKYSLLAADEALEMAFGESFDELPISKYDAGCIIGTGWGGLDSSIISNNDYIESGYGHPLSTILGMPSVATAAVSMNWQLRGVQNTPVAACATGTIAIGEAYQKIKNGEAKVILAGGAESLKEAFNVWSIDIIQALSKEQDDVTRACCPFSLDRSGFVLSEGAAVVCLEDYDLAKQRGANILAEVVGYSNYTDAFDMTAPAEDMGARQMIIADLHKQSGVSHEKIDYINLHGTSTPINDRNECNTIKAVYGDLAYEIPMSSTKSYTGHLIGAAGSLETALCVKAMQDKVMPATVNLNNADPECDLNFVPNEHVFNSELEYVMNVSFGFGGTNAGLLLRNV